MTAPGDPNVVWPRRSIVSHVLLILLFLGIPATAGAGGIELRRPEPSAAQVPHMSGSSSVVVISPSLRRLTVGEEGWTELMEAAFQGNTAAVRDLLSKQADVNAKTVGGATALMVAASGGHREIVQALLAKGAEVNAKSVAGETALVSAVAQGHILIVQTLLDSDADIHVKDYSGIGLLQTAVMRGREAIVRALLDKGANPSERNTYGGTPLTEAIRSGREGIAQALLEYGADLRVKEANGKTPLLLTAERGFAPLISSLLSKGADPNAADADGNTALIATARQGLTTAVRLLLDKGADITAKNKQGLTALMAAANAGSLPVVDLLIDRGTDVNARDLSGLTALLHAPKGGNESLVGVLLKKGAEVTAHDLELLLDEVEGWKVETWRALLQGSSSADKEAWNRIATALIYFQQTKGRCDLKQWNPATQSSAFLLSMPQCPDQVSLSEAGDNMLAISGKTLHHIALKPAVRLVASIQRPFEPTVEADGTLKNIFRRAGYLRDGRLAIEYERQAPGQGDAKPGNPTIRSLYVFDNNSWELAEEKPCDDVGECFPPLSRGSAYTGRGFAIWSPKLSFNPFVVARGLAAWDGKKFILDKRVEDVPHKEPQPQWSYVKFNIKGKQALVMYDAEPGAHSSDLSTYRIVLQTAKNRRPVKLAEDQNFTLVEGKYLLVWERSLRIFDLETGKEPLKG